MKHMFLQDKNGSAVMMKERGFTLIEVMIALVILGVGIMAIVALQVKDMSYNAGSKRQSEGYNWAMDRVERLQNLPFADPFLNVKGSSPAIVGDGHLDTDPNQSGAGDDVYSVEWDVRNNPNVPNTKIVNVFVRRNNEEVARLDFTKISI